MALTNSCGRSLRLGAAFLMLSTALPFAASADNAAPISAPATTTAESNGISSFTLDNGMEVVVIPDHRAPIVTHMVWYKVGSATNLPASPASPTSSSI